MGNSVFSEKQFNDIYPEGIENHYWNGARNCIILNFLKKHHLKSEEILEIGCGRGIVSKFLNDSGLKITCVELADVKPVKGTEAFFYGNTDAFQLPDELKEKFTVILLFDVIEHIEDPILFLEKLIYSFPQLKYIVITVPARQELWTNYDEYNGHFKRYTLKDLKRLSNQRMKSYNTMYFNHILYPVFWFYSKLFKKRNTALKAPHGYEIAVHRLLSKVLYADYLLMPGSLTGTSCISLFQVTK
jgi:hypothetical protein